MTIGTLERIAEETVIPRAETEPGTLAATAHAVSAEESDTFAAPLSPEVRRAIAEMGYVEPTPVQSEVIPLLLSGRDVVGQSQTGTGKTAAFAVPIAERLSRECRRPQAIVLVPTRELAVQVAGEIERLSRYRGLRVLAAYGGEGMKRQTDALQRGAHVVVGTPGRVLDHIRRGNLRLDGIRVAVLDEADEMLDIGFAADMEAILRRTPRGRQTALFSATMPPFIQRMIRLYLRDPQMVSINPDERTVERVDQVFFEVAEDDKVKGFCELLESDPSFERLLVFRRTQRGVDRLAEALSRRGYPVKGIHGGMSQRERNQVMREFREGRLRILVATNVAARGLDIQDISHVVNFDIPQTVEEYVHRIGRTARAGKAGTAITFVAEWDFELFDAIQAAMGDRLRQKRLAMYGPGRAVGTARR